MFNFGLKCAASMMLATVPFLGCGCGESEQRRPAARTGGELVVVNFQEGQPLRYRMVAERHTQIDLVGGNSSARPSRPQTMTERLELVMVYTPIEVDPFGLTTVRAVCESAKVTRTSFSGRGESTDAVESLPQLPYTLTLTPTGEIADKTAFEAVVQELGKRAFAEVRPTAGRVKNPDMISDFVALQRSVWKVSSSLDDPTEGLTAGKTWTTQHYTPWPSPLPSPTTRLTTFRVERIEKDENGQPKRAHLTSRYAMSDTPLTDVPGFYDGSFQMRGMFGFLRQYRFRGIDGAGEQVFNIADGILERDHQRYTLDVEASFMLPLGDSKPVLTVEQTLSIELLQ